MDGQTIVHRFNALDSARKNLDGILEQVERFVVPYRGEFYKDMSSEHEVDWTSGSLYDNTAGVSVQLLASQMHGNLTSPVNKWFTLQFRDPDLNSDVGAKTWLESADDKCWQTIQESNFDTSAPEMYTDISSFGTHVMTMEDEQDLVWEGVQFNALPVMDAYFEAGPDGKPYRVYRELRYTQLELQTDFDLPRDLKVAKKDLDLTDVDTKIEIIWCVYKEPKNEGREGILSGELRPVQFRYVHKASGKIIKKKSMPSPNGGYYEFPGMTIRWGKTAGSNWGFSPAIQQLSDIKMLNELTALKSEAVAKAVDPPMMAVEQNIMQQLDNVPGGLTIVSDIDGLRPLVPSTDFYAGITEENRLQESIRAGFMVDKLELKDSPAMTATEVQIRYERMLRLLAPVLGRLKADFLMPVVEGVFNKLMRMNQLGDIPESAMGAELDIEFTGPLPRALKGEIADGMERWLLGMAQQIEMNPQALDIVNFDEYNREMGILRGVPMKVLIPRKEVDATRQGRAQAEAAKQKLEMVNAQATAGEQMGKATTAMNEAGIDPEAAAGALAPPQ